MTTGPLGIKKLLGVHYYVRDLPRSRRFYRDYLGFSEIGKSSDALAQAGRQESLVFRAGDAVVVCSTPAGEGGRAGRYLAKHPDGIGTLAFEVADIDHTFDELERRGGTPITDILTFEHGGGKIRTFSITSPFGDTTFRFIQNAGYPGLFPGMETYPSPQGDDNPFEFTTIDHVTSNFQTMKPALLWLEHVLGFEPLWEVEFHTRDVTKREAANHEAAKREAAKREAAKHEVAKHEAAKHEAAKHEAANHEAAKHEAAKREAAKREAARDAVKTGSGLRSKVMWDPATGIKFANNEPYRPSFKQSQINVFNEEHRGDGVQHLALATRDIVAAVRGLRERGVEFMPTPGAYYDMLPARLEREGIGSVSEDLDTLRELGILVDGHGPGAYLLQIFLKDSAGLYGSAEAGPFFFEIIQRKGDQGFGAGNFRALFESIERQQQSDGAR